MSKEEKSMKKIYHKPEVGCVDFEKRTVYATSEQYAKKIKNMQKELMDVVSFEVSKIKGENHEMEKETN